MSKDLSEEALYFLQPDGSWKRGGDGRSAGRRRSEIPHGDKIVEDAPTNSAGGGAVAGIGVGPDGEPGKRMKLKKQFDAFLRRLK